MPGVNTMMTLAGGVLMSCTTTPVGGDAKHGCSYGVTGSLDTDFQI